MVSLNSDIFVLMQGRSERRHRVDGEVCGQKHTQATQTEGHHVRGRQHSLHLIWTVSFSLRTFHVNPGVDYCPPSSCCCDFEQFGVHYRQSATVFLSPSIIPDVLWMDVCLFHLLHIMISSASCVSSSLCLTPALWAQKHQFDTWDTLSCNLMVLCLFTVSD